jgi:formate dehydrogenase gamma subunit
MATNTIDTPKTIDTYVRFDLSQRIQHILLIVAFTLLSLTGLPQLFTGARWAQIWLSVFGELDGARLIHHLSGVLLGAVFIYHVVTVIVDLIVTRSRRMLPGIQDMRDAIRETGFLLGKRPDKPLYDRFDFRQKVEYWALIWGTILMGLTGLILMFPEIAARRMPGIVIYAAKAAHGMEAFLAILSIIIWHMYNAHFVGGKLAFDSTIFNGRITRERIMEEHPLEYKRLSAAEGGESSDE